LGLETKKQSGLALPRVIYRYSITALRIHVSPLQPTPGLGKRKGWKREIIAARAFAPRHIPDGGLTLKSRLLD
jgi:hypothetical protein